MHRKFISLIFTLGCSLAGQLFAQNSPNSPLKLSTPHIELSFSPQGELLGIVSGNKQIAGRSEGLWEISALTRDGKSIEIKPELFKKFESKRTEPQTLELTWSQPTGLNNLVVTAKVAVKELDSLSYWDFTVEGFHGLALESVRYPIISKIEADPSSFLATPNWMGHLMKDPLALLNARGNKTYRLVYPGGMSMQFLTVYTPQRSGIYFACNDANSFQKDFVLKLNTAGDLTYHTISLPEYSFEQNSYAIPYQTVVGVHHGDWFTAAEIYRAWAIKQAWTQNSRLKNRVIPEWLDKTALWIWNRGRAHEVLTPAIHAREKLGLPVSVLWHWWHRSSYDDTFPDYLPPRDGSNRFIQEVAKARDKQVNAIVYMNQLQWAKSTPSWTAENAILSAAKNRDGSTTDHVYNIFTGKSLTNMCIATETWRRKYTSLADSVLNHYKVSGIYMDQACLSRMCFDPSHGHPLGGGNYWMQGSGQLTKDVRNVTSQDQKGKITLSGEGVGESWLPYLDAFLALQVSMERYAGVGAEPIPLFQAVYHPYAVIYGNYSSLLKPPYDEMWPADQRPADALELLEVTYQKQFLMEQARSFVWGMQPMLSNYKPELEKTRAKEMRFLYSLAKIRHKMKDYLLYGEMKQNIAIDLPMQKIGISKLSIYAGQKDKVTHYEKAYPTLYSSVWRTENGRLGIALANIADKDEQIPIRLRLQDYGVNQNKSVVYLVTDNKRKKLTETTGNQLDINVTVPAMTPLFIEIDTK